VTTWITIALLLFGLWRVARPVWAWGVEAVALAFGAPDDPGEAAMYAPDAPDYGAALAADDADDDTPLRADEWLRLLNAEPDIVPHIAAYGTTGAGKTQLIQAVLSQRGGALVITTPKPAVQDRWNGFPAVRLVYHPETQEPSYRAMADAIEAVYRELNWRGMQDAAGEPLTLIIDELSTTIAEARREGRDLVPWLIAIWLRGRSAGVRLITMDPTINVRGWGLDGRGDVRANIAFVRCERGTYRAWLGELEEVRDDPARAVELDTAMVLSLAQHAPAPGQVWQPPTRGTSSAAGAAPAGDIAQPTSATATRYETNLVRAWYEGGETGMRALARRLYAARGGQPPYDGSGGPYYAVRGALQGVSDETLFAAL